jgi:hypothetical protein
MNGGKSVDGQTDCGLNGGFNDTAEAQSNENREEISSDYIGKDIIMRRRSMWLILKHVYDYRDFHP